MNWILIIWFGGFSSAKILEKVYFDTEKKCLEAKHVLKDVDFQNNSWCTKSAQ